MLLARDVVDISISVQSVVGDDFTRFVDHRGLLMSAVVKHREDAIERQHICLQGHSVCNPRTVD
eukprot:1248453-Pyramimonas_sp.AAC.1